MRVLVVEDEESMASGISAGLRRSGMAVDVALDGATALEKADVSDYDVVVLDRDLPVLHGDDVCRQLKGRNYAARIIMLTAAGLSGERVQGLRMGADDYLSKPFDLDELTLRVLNLARRPPRNPVVTVADLEVDIERKLVKRGERTIELTAREFAVLQVLLDAAGGVVSQEQLLEKAWDENADPFTQSVRVIVSRLRKKLGEPQLIHTTVGAGYRI